MRRLKMEKESRKHNIIIATQKTTFADDLKKHFERNNAKVHDIVVVLGHLKETILGFEEEGIKIDAVILTSDISRRLDKPNLELLSDTILDLRKNFRSLNI